MITSSPIRTERLEMIPATHDILVSDRSDRKRLADLLDAAVPSSWPPPLLSEDVLDDFIRIESGKKDPFFSSWYWVRDEAQADGGRVLIGSGGAASSSVETGTVYIGYVVLAAYQKMGYTTEAIRHLLPVIFSHPGIRRVRATTFPDLTASIRVLEKNGFVFSGKVSGREGAEEGAILYTLEKPAISSA